MKWQTTVAQIAYNILGCLLVAIFYALYVLFVAIRATIALFNPGDFKDYLNELSTFLHRIS